MIPNALPVTNRVISYSRNYSSFFYIQYPCPDSICSYIGDIISMDTRVCQY